MIQLRTGEQVLMKVHKHWFLIFSHLVAILFIGLLPFFLFLFSNTLFSFIEAPSRYPLVLFMSALYWLFLLGLFYVEWIDYWFDVWIITNMRVIAIDQRGLFRRETSEFFTDHVQDITVEVPGFMGTFLKFGTITVQTAGERSFTADSMPNPNFIKQCIMDCVQKNRLASKKD